jgi:hypothetical protein
VPVPTGERFRTPQKSGHEIPQKTFAPMENTADERGEALSTLLRIQ